METHWLIVATTRCLTVEVDHWFTIVKTWRFNFVASLWFIVVATHWVIVVAHYGLLLQQLIGSQNGKEIEMVNNHFPSDARP